MNPRRVATEQRAIATIPAPAHAPGRWLLAARIAAGTIAVLALLLFAAYVPPRFAQLQTVCTATTCAPQQLTPALVRSLAGTGLSVRWYAGVTLLLDIVVASAYVAIGAVIAWRRPRDRMALFVALFLVLFGTTTASDVQTLVETLPPTLRGPDRLVRLLSFVLLPLFFYLFPDGRFVPRWTRWLALLWIAWRVLLVLFPTGPWGALMPVLWPAFLLSWIGAQVYRYLRVSTLAQRQQTKWVVLGVVLALGAATLLRSLRSLLAPPNSLLDWAMTAGMASQSMVVSRPHV